MSYRRVILWGITLSCLLSLMSGCSAASPTPIFIEVADTPTQVPPRLPQVGLPQATAIPTTGNTGPFPAVPTATIEGTLEVQASPTLPPPLERPFLMKIDRISVITGQGTLLEGRVANGTLPADGSVEILGPQGDVLNPSILNILVMNTTRDQVTVGDYAGILVGGVEATELSPGMLLAEAGRYESFEAALQQLQ